MNIKLNTCSAKIANKNTYIQTKELLTKLGFSNHLGKSLIEVCAHIKGLLYNSGL